jgi:hypothetical protein
MADLLIRAATVRERFLFDEAMFSPNPEGVGSRFFATRL